MDETGLARPAEPDAESFNPWSIVNLVFHHLADKGLHPVPAARVIRDPPAAALLSVARGIEPAVEGNRQVARDVRDHLGDDLYRRAG